MSIKTNWLSAFVFIFLSVCAPLSFALEVWDNTITEKKFTHYRTSAWAGDNFKGKYLRIWDDELTVPWLYFELNQFEGDWDATIARDSLITTRIDQTPVNRSVGYKYDFRDLKGEGVWWIGAKVVVYSSKAWNHEIGIDGNYECYIVENSKLTAEQLASRLGLQPAGESWHWGRKYNHYTSQLGQIKQVWSIREDIPRNPVASEREYIPVGQIKHEWRSRNLIKHNWYPLGWMVYLETQGKIYGSRPNNGIGYFSELWLPFNGEEID